MIIANEQEAMRLASVEITRIDDEHSSTRFISPATFTRMTSISRYKLRDLIRSGQIVAKRCDGRILVDLASVNRWMDALPAETYAEDAPPESSLDECMQSHNEYMAKAKLDLF